MNWKALVEKNNAKLYVLPEGWTTREKVAEQLECSPDRVAQHLAPAIKEGTVEGKQFPIWDKLTKRVIRVTAYKESKHGEKSGVSSSRTRTKSGRFAVEK